MKKLVVGAMLLAVVMGFGCAEEAEPPEPELVTRSEKGSYAVGVSVAKSLEQFPVEVDRDAFVAGFDDARGEEGPRLTPQEVNAVIAELQSMSREQATARANAAEQELARANLEKGRVFLAENATKEGVKTTPSGLQYIVIKEGTGKKPAATDTVRVHYMGTTIDGKEFDSSYKRGAPLERKANELIKGWTEALQMMPVGSKWKLFAPSDLAYGPQRVSADIGPNETLIFEMELIGIEQEEKDET
jgi:FKBP-type peptidyl-prolyl cis-trans isomerase